VDPSLLLSSLSLPTLGELEASSSSLESQSSWRLSSSIIWYPRRRRIWAATCAAAGQSLAWARESLVESLAAMDGLLAGSALLAGSVLLLLVLELLQDSLLLLRLVPLLVVLLPRLGFVLSVQSVVSRGLN